MAKKYLDYDGLLYFWQKLKTVFLTDVSYNSTSKKIQKTKNGSTSDVVTLATVATSGSYNDLSNKPTIPTGVEKTTTTPLMDGTAAIGSEVKFAAGDHVHPTDTSRAPLASPAFTGTPTAPTAAVATDSTQIATTAFVHDVVDDLSNADLGHVVGSCSTASDTVDKVVTVDGNDYTLKAGGVVTVYFENGCSTIKTLNIAGQGAKYVQYLNTTTSSSMSVGTDIPTRTHVVFQYDGTIYHLTGVYSLAISNYKDGLMSSADKAKLDGIATGAEVNQNAFSKVAVSGQTTVEADAKTDTLTLVAGSNVTLTTDATNDKVTIAATDTTYSDFTGPTSGSAGTHGLVPAPAVGSDTNFLIGSGNWASVDIKGKNSSDSWYSIVQQISGSATSLAFALKNATTSLAGLMSSSDKTKLDGIATGAEVNQNAFSNVKVGNTTVAADSKTDTLELVAGTNIILTPDATNDKVTINVATITDDEVQYQNGSSWSGLNDATDVGSAINILGNMMDGEFVEWNDVGVASGVCPLNASSKIDSTYLPSYVDDVVEAYARSGQTPLSQNWLSLTSGGAALTPETGKIYILMADTTDYAANTQFRWSGTTYVKLNDGGVSSITNAEIDTIMAS